MLVAKCGENNKLLRRNENYMIVLSLQCLLKAFKACLLFHVWKLQVKYYYELSLKFKTHN